MSSKDKEQQREEQKEAREQVICPVGKFFMEFCFPKNSRFIEHLTRSKIEFLKAIRAMIDEKIEHLEKASSPKRKVTKIEVE